MSTNRRRGPGRRPGALPHPATNVEEKRAKIQARIKREVARYDFSRRAVELRRDGKTWVEIASVMTEERGEPISANSVKRAALQQLRNVEAEQDARYEELDKLESMAARLKRHLDDMDAAPAATLDLEVYAKVSDQYLKYRERIAKLMGFDRGGINGKQQPLAPGAIGKDAFGKDVFPQPGQSSPLHLTVNMPGSINAFEEWRKLAEAGVAQVAKDVLELESGDDDIVDALVVPNREGQGVVLAPHADVTPGAERQMSALDALAMLHEPEEATG